MAVSATLAAEERMTVAIIGGLIGELLKSPRRSFPAAIRRQRQCQLAPEVPDGCREDVRLSVHMPHQGQDRSSVPRPYAIWSGGGDFECAEKSIENCNPGHWAGDISLGGADSTRKTGGRWVRRKTGMWGLDHDCTLVVHIYQPLQDFQRNVQTIPEASVIRGLEMESNALLMSQEDEYTDIHYVEECCVSAITWAETMLGGGARISC